MPPNIIFLDRIRQVEIDTFYDACQMQRDYYRGYPKSYHPLTYFNEPGYMFQCPPEITTGYLSFPAYHIKYRQPVILPATMDRTSGFPQMPDRTLGARFNKGPCKLFVR